VETVARLVVQRWVLVYRQGGHSTLQRWVRWLEDRDAVKGHPVIAVIASGLYAMAGSPVEAERWADALDHWQYQDTDWAGDTATEAWTAMLRALLCRRGVEQMRTDAEEAARKFTAAGIVLPNPDFYRGMACLLTGDLNGADAFFQDAVTVAEQIDAQEMLVVALCERSIVAMARRD
jgi:LuxR family maltose regulon positive regulatory protein